MRELDAAEKTEPMHKPPAKLHPQPQLLEMEDVPARPLVFGAVVHGSFPWSEDAVGAR